jgi:hypothetical protein
MLEGDGQELPFSWIPLLGVIDKLLVIQVL